MIKKAAIAIVAVVAVLALTKPTEQAHAQRLVEHAKESCGDNALSRALCGGVASIATAGLRYDDHLLYSTAELGDNRTIGALGQVLVTK